MDAPGKPQAWCETRQELCEGLPYFRSFQSGLYKQDGLAKGYLIDGFCAERDVWNGKVFISHGGGSQAAPRTGTGLKARKSATCVASRSALPLGASQQETHSAIRALNATMNAGVPFVVIMGAHYSLADFKIPHRYCVLGYYVITDCWNEKEYVEGGTGEFHVRWKYRFEWAEGNPVEPWFRTTENELEEEVTTEAADPYTCAECLSESPAVYTAPMCLKSGCPRFWKYLCCDVWHDPPPNLELNKRFISPRPSARHDASKSPLASVRPVLECAQATRHVPRALCCPCGRISQRMTLLEWKCPSCEKSISYSKFISNDMTFASSSRLDDRGCALLQEGSRIVRYEDVIADNPLLAGLLRVTYLLPTGGRVEHIRARPGHKLAEEGKAIFRQFQHDVELQRWRHTVHRVKGFVTQNYCHNAGRAYSHAVKLPATDFEHDPPVIQRAREILQKISPQSKINELLSMFYLQGQKMAFHDDGESEVQGPIVGWSLGSDSIMRFREKTPSSKSDGCSKTSSRVKRKRDEVGELNQPTENPAVVDCTSQGGDIKRQRAPPPPSSDGKLHRREDTHLEPRQLAMPIAEPSCPPAALAVDVHQQARLSPSYDGKLRMSHDANKKLKPAVQAAEPSCPPAALGVDVHQQARLPPRHKGKRGVNAGVFRTAVQAAELPGKCDAVTVDVNQRARPPPNYREKLCVSADARDELKLAAAPTQPSRAGSESRKISSHLEAGFRKAKAAVLSGRLCESLKPPTKKEQRGPRQKNYKKRLRQRLEKSRNNAATARVPNTKCLPSTPEKSPMALSAMLNPLPVSSERRAPVSPSATPTDIPLTGNTTQQEDLDMSAEPPEAKAEINPGPTEDTGHFSSEPPEAKAETRSELPEPREAIRHINPEPPEAKAETHYALPELFEVMRPTNSEPSEAKAEINREPLRVETDANPAHPETVLETKPEHKPARRPQRKTVLELLTRHGDVVIMIGPSVQRYYEHAAQPTGLRLCVTGRTLSAPGDVATYVDPPWTQPPGAILLPPFYKRKTTTSRG
ncbi:hypothetical protein HDU88_004549 [Geranomyces variabilis]|nr:hypothetical protein HDU88_004549 [Geranomyces variabilis]